MEPSRDICRLCLCKLTTSPRFSIRDNKVRCKLDTVFNFPIIAEDNCPSRVCQECYSKVDEFHAFSETVRINQDQLKVKTTYPFHTVIVPDLKEEEPEQLDESGCVTDTIDVKVELHEHSNRDNGKPKVEESSNDDSDDDADDDDDGESNFSEEEEVYEPAPKRKMGRPKKQKEEVQRQRIYNIKSKEEREKENQQLKEFYKMKCDLCEFTAKDFHKLKMHFQKAHDTSGYVICCDKKLDKRNDMLDHLVLHKNPDAYRCEICNKSYKKKCYLEQHKANIHAGTPEQANAGKIKCDQCDKVLANKNSLTTHIANVHKTRQMTCGTCGETFHNKNEYRKHVHNTGHMGQDVVKQRKAVQCHICQKWLDNKWFLRRHIEFTHYSVDQALVCDICQKSYPHSRALESHKTQVHREDKFHCEFCGKAFKRKVSLMVHLTRHTDEKRYSCEYCGISMNFKSKLEKHIKSQHPFEWAAEKMKKEGTAEAFPIDASKA